MLNVQFKNVIFDPAPKVPEPSEVVEKFVPVLVKVQVSNTRSQAPPLPIPQLGAEPAVVNVTPYT